MSYVTTNQSAVEGKESIRRKPNIAATLLALLGFGGMGFAVFSARGSQQVAPVASPNAAQVTVKPIEVAPQLSGVVARVAVTDGQIVRQGDLLFTLDEAPLQQAFLQAQTTLDQVKSQTKQAVASVGLSGEVGDPKIQPGFGPSGPIVGRITGSTIDLGRFQKGLSEAQFQASAAQKSLTTAQALVSSLTKQLEEAKGKVPEAEAKLPVAEAALKEAAAAVGQLTHKVEKAKSDADRFQMLLKDGVVSAREAERMTVRYEAAQAANDAAKDQIRAATDDLNERKQEVEEASNVVSKLEDKLIALKASLPGLQVRANSAGNLQRQASAKLETARTSVRRVRGSGEEVMGEIAQAGLAPVAVQVKAVPPQVTEVNARKAEVGLKAAQDRLALAKVFASAGGRVQLRGLAVGARVEAGRVVLSILPAK